MFLFLAPLFVSASAFAQISPCLERQLPIPSLADELRQRKAETPKQIVSIESVAFEGEFEWPEPIRAQITTALKQRRFDASTEWIGKLENLARGVLQDRGYFLADPKATVQVLQDDALLPRVSVTLKDNKLEQFWLEDIRIRNFKDDDPELVFSREQLRALIPVQPGDVFSTQKIREGFEALRRLYGTKGYVDVTAAPLTELDKEHRRIWLTIEIDEQKQFFVEKIEIFGLNPSLERNLRSIVKLGAPLNWTLVEGFFKTNRSLLPPEVSTANVRVIRDSKNGTVELLFDFRPCPPFDPPPKSELPETRRNHLPLV